MLDQWLLNDPELEKLRADCYFTFLSCVSLRSLRKFDRAIQRQIEIFRSESSLRTIAGVLDSASWSSDLELKRALKPIIQRWLSQVRATALRIRMSEELSGIDINTEWLDGVLGNRKFRSYAAEIFHGTMNDSYELRTHIEIAIQQFKQSQLARLQGQLVARRKSIGQLEQNMVDGLPAISEEIAELNCELQSLTDLEVVEREQQRSDEQAACEQYEAQQRQLAEAVIVRDRQRQQFQQELEDEALLMSPSPSSEEILANVSDVFARWLQNHPEWDLPEPDSNDD